MMIIVHQTKIKIKPGEILTQNGNLETTFTLTETKMVARVKEGSEEAEMTEEEAKTEEEEVSIGVGDLTEIEVQIMEILGPVKKRLITTVIRTTVEIGTIGTEVTLTLEKMTPLAEMIILDKITIMEETTTSESLTTMAGTIIIKGMMILETKTSTIAMIALEEMIRVIMLETINVLEIMIGNNETKIIEIVLKERTGIKKQINGLIAGAQVKNRKNKSTIRVGEGLAIQLLKKHKGII